MADKNPVEKHPAPKPEVQAAVEGANAPQVVDTPVASPPLNAEIHPQPSAAAVAARAAYDRAQQGGGAVVAATQAASPDDLAAVVHAAGAHQGNASVYVQNESDRSAVQKLITTGKHAKVTVKVDAGLGVRCLWRAHGAG